MMTDFKTLIEQAKVTVNMTKADDYLKKFNSHEVRQARNNWHRAAIEVDETLRYAGQHSKQYLRAVETETKAHELYCSQKIQTQILNENTD